MPLELRVPAERVAPPKDLELRPRHAKAWLESLPLHKSEETGSRILANLVAMNRAKVNADDRFQLLETYRLYADVVFGELDAFFGRSPPPPGAREALDLCRALATEFAYGYKIVIIEKSGSFLAFGAKKQMPFLVYRAMESLVQLLHASYRSYTAVPAVTWHDIHQLYLHAEKEHFAKEPADAKSKASVADLYATTLLIALTDPYRLSSGEVDKVLQVIRNHHSAVTLGQDRPATNSGGHFLVPCDQDKPPKPLLSANDDPGGPNWRILDANPIVDTLRTRQLAVATGDVSAAMRKALNPDLLALMEKLAKLWGDPPKRASRRDPRDTRVAICAGLDALTHFVSIEPKNDPGKERDAIERAITIPLISVPRDDASRHMAVNAWEVLNESLGGLKVFRTGAFAAQAIAVGEIVGVKSMGSARWVIGMVRWVTLRDEGGTECGIQFLAPSATCVTVHAVVNQAGRDRPGLLLAGHDDAESAARLLTPPATYSELREFEITDSGRVARVRATSLVEQSGSFEMFHIVPS